ncbi:hypothetical protein PSPO01_03870 [Paraphaeosphaeria sporulosa]
MRYTAFFAIFILFSTTLACKFLKDGNNVVDQTKYCCTVDFSGGEYDEAKQDCGAHSISERPRYFSSCCHNVGFTTPSTVMKPATTRCVR